MIGHTLPLTTAVGYCSRNLHCGLWQRVRNLRTGEFTNEHRMAIFPADQRRTVVFFVTELMRLTAPTKVAGILFLAVLIVLGLGPRTLADTIDAGHFVEAAGGFELPFSRPRADIDDRGRV